MVLQRDFSRLLNAPLHPLKESSFTRSWETTTQRDDDVLFLAETPPGLVLRAFVVREEAVSALVCVPFYVIGDGEKTLQELIDDKVRLRRRHAFLAERVPFRNAAPTATDTVSQLREVLPPGVIRALGRSVNPFHEGIPVDVTDLISPHLKELAVDAAWAVPGLTAGAVDIITPQLESSDETLVMGLDATARLELHHYPALGKPRPVAEMMMSAMVRRDH